MGARITDSLAMSIARREDREEVHFLVTLLEVNIFPHNGGSLN